ncbi:MAG TPA: hypothetical protein VMD56_00175 [Steroidobacteraceae bacterium]|nr:hypothetical protein [Steroidobacteraceae bacterium]
MSRLRTLLLAVSSALVLAGVAMLIAGPKLPGIELLVIGLLFLLGTLFERWRYRPSSPAGAHWEPTGERFEDPHTGKVVEVLYDPRSGQRRYSAADEERDGQGRGQGQGQGQG